MVVRQATVVGVVNKGEVGVRVRVCFSFLFAGCFGLVFYWLDSPVRFVSV